MTSVIIFRTSVKNKWMSTYFLREPADRRTSNIFDPVVLYFLLHFGQRIRGNMNNELLFLTLRNGVTDFIIIWRVLQVFRVSGYQPLPDNPVTLFIYFFFCNVLCLTSRMRTRVHWYTLIVTSQVAETGVLPAAVS
jgi:hypothetical protein